MARVTIEDCLEQVPTRFGLIHLAAKRVRQIFRGRAGSGQRGQQRNRHGPAGDRRGQNRAHHPLESPAGTRSGVIPDPRT